MASEDWGSLTKEPPLAKLDATIRVITPGMSYADLLDHARANTHRDAPGLVSKRFLLVKKDRTIAYDHFLSLAAVHQLESPFIRKIMYFLWAYRDDRIRRFICERIANKAGEWRTTQLTDKANAKFFEKWLQASTARKARSNFEYFLVEAGIFDFKTRTIHLELNDGWLEQAAIAASQHERDAAAREELLANPVEFLEKRGWLGLLNTTQADLPFVSPILSTDSLPLEDNLINVEPTTLPKGSDWGRSSPTGSGKKTALANIDLVARERANKSHFVLEEILADLAKRNKFAPKRNQNIDMYFDAHDRTVIVEVKSCTDSNFHSQLRKGVSQLFEYRFFYRSLFKPDVIMLLLMETVPPKEKAWLVDYVSSLGIVLAWKQSGSQVIISTCTLPQALLEIVTPARK